MEELTNVQEDLILEREILEDLEDKVEHCDWCGEELNESHNDDMCKYLNR